MIKLRLYLFYLNMIYSKNEACGDTWHHQFIYAMLKLKSWIRVKIFIYN